MNTIDKILQVLQSGNMKTGLEMLVRYASEHLADDPGLKTASINILARYNQLVRRRIGGVIADSEMQISENQIRFQALDMIEVLRDEDIMIDVPKSGRKSNSTPSKRTRILFLGAEPSDKARLKVDEEVRKIEDALYNSQVSDQFELVKFNATRPDDLMKKILEFKPEFVHFAGHGNKDGIFMLDDRGQSKLIPTEDLGQVFRFFREVVGCVILNSCYSRPQAMRIHDYIPHVVGSTFRVENKSAMTFASLFYTAIADGQEIPHAYEFARIGTNLNEMDGDNFILI